jgi:hypothetical protein
LDLPADGQNAEMDVNSGISNQAIHKESRTNVVEAVLSDRMPANNNYPMNNYEQ